MNPYLRMYRGLNRDSHSIILGDGPKRRMVGTSSASIGTHDFHLHFRLYFRVMARFSFRPPQSREDRYLYYEYRCIAPLNGNASDDKDNCATTKHFGRDEVLTTWKIVYSIS